MADRALTTTDEAPLLPAQSEWALMLDMARSLVPTGFLPETIKKPEQAVAIMLKGRELRVPPMYALSNIVIVKGKPTVSAEMMLALIYRDHGKKAIRVKESTNERCTVEYRLDGWEGTSEYTFTIADAKLAGIYQNMWLKYPAAMLRARCISSVARMAFPESIGGMYVPGELGDDVTVTADGEVVSVTGSIVNQQTGEITPITEDPWERASKRLHAVAASEGFTHDDLHAWAVEKGFGSVKNAPASSLQAMADGIRDRPGDARKYFERWRSEQDTTASPETIEAEHRPINVGPPTPEEMDRALNNSTPGSLPLDMVDSNDPERFTR